MQQWVMYPLIEVHGDKITKIILDKNKKPYNFDFTNIVTSYYNALDLQI